MVRAGRRACRPLKRARILGMHEDPRLKPGATVLMPASPASRKSSDIVIVAILLPSRNPRWVRRDSGSKRVARGASAFCEQPLVAEVDPSRAASAALERSRLAYVIPVPLTRHTTMSLVPGVLAKKRSHPWLPSSSPLSRRLAFDDEGPRFAGEAGVRTVAPGFSRRFERSFPYCEPALAGDSKPEGAR